MKTKDASISDIVTYLKRSKRSIYNILPNKDKMKKKKRSGRPRSTCKGHDRCVVTMASHYSLYLCQIKLMIGLLNSKNMIH